MSDSYQEQRRAEDMELRRASVKTSASDVPSAKEYVHAALKIGIAALLDQCTPKEVAFFNRIWPKGIDALDYDQLVSSYELCRRTVVKNRNKR